MPLKTTILTILLAFSGHSSAIWPLPKQLNTGSTILKLADDFDITFVGDESAPQDLLDAVSRTKDFINNDQLQRLVIGRGASDAESVASAPSLSGLVLSMDSGFSGQMKSLSEEAMEALEDRVEGYSLTVPADGSQAELKANSTLGLFRGLTTFSQLWYDLDGAIYTVEAPIDIVDEPAFPYRGLMLDTARNFFPVPDIKRTLDAMSWVKINTFHWHIVDSQSFPLQVPGFPELSAAGPYAPSLAYTPEDVRDIVDYAAARGIDVLPEIDTPGHTMIISKAFPEHIACAEAKPWADFANEPPAGQLRLASASTTNFTQSLFASASSLFPGKFFSSGGDELNTNCYEKDPETQADLAKSGKTLEQALDTFVQGVHGVLHEKGKTAVVWEEMVLEHNITLANNTVVMVWISSDHAASVAQAGFRFVHAPSDFFYLDCGGGEFIGADPEGNSWCDPFKTWQKSYTFDPLANLTERERGLVLGGQQLLWTEQSSPSNLDPILWPRAASSAEVFWSGPGKDVSAALPRLHDLGFRMNQRGVRAIPLQPMYCALRPGVCDLTA